MRGATGRLVQDLAYALGQSGWQVTVLTTGDKAGSEVKKNVTIRRLKGARHYKNIFGYGLTWLRLLFTALKMKRHDIVVTLTDPPMQIVIGRIITRLKGMMHVHWCQDLYPDLFEVLRVRLPGFLSSFLFSLSRRSLNKCNKIIVVGRCMAKKLADTGVDSQKITMIANWADFEVITSSNLSNKDNSIVEVTGTAKRPEEMFRDDSPKFRILYAGNIGRAHPMRSVIEAAEILKEHAEIEFVFVGDKHVHSIFARERGKRGLENIKFMPYQPIERLRDVMESGDIHLVTMRRQAKGMLVPCKFYSGLTVGRPTIFIGPEESEIADVIHDYNAGIVVPAADAKALADAIYQYRSDGEFWFQAQEGALRAAQAYHPNQSLHKWLEVLEEVRVSG